jgi:hypothetical protein
MKKICKVCGEEKDSSEFSISYTNKDRLRSDCKKCFCKYVKDKRGYKGRSKHLAYKIRTKDYSKDTYLIAKHNITLEQYKNLLTNQNNKCKICGAEQGTLNKELFVDHDHETGKIRGLLCQNCNFGIGLLKDDISILEKALEYLKEFKK